jgi:hypothetical protein
MITLTFNLICVKSLDLILLLNFCFAFFYFLLGHFPSLVKIWVTENFETELKVGKIINKIVEYLAIREIVKETL